jgi:hypothetical protein
LAHALNELADAAVRQGLARCRELSGGEASPFKEEKDLRKKDLVVNWILKQSAHMAEVLPTTEKSKESEKKTGKKVYSLKKDVVEELIRQIEAQQGERLEEDRKKQEARGDEPDPGEVEETDTPVGESGEDAEVADEEVTVPPQVVEFLKARFAALRVTRGKIDSAVKGVVDGRLHDLFVYFGAHTGRPAGRRFNILNLPKPKQAVPVWDWEVKDSKKEVVGRGPGLVTAFEDARKALPENVAARIDPAKAQEILDQYYRTLRMVDPNVEPANLDDAASALLRCTVLPDDGEFITAGDFAAIEFRVAGEMAGSPDIIKIFVDKLDPYIFLAESIYGRKALGKKDPIRQTGKVGILGCGYQMGERKLAAFAAAMGVDLAAVGSSPRAVVQGFRDQFPHLAGWRTGDLTPDGQPIRKGGIWNDLNYGAIRALQDGRAKVGPIKFQRRSGDLLMWLPSGRPIVYRSARLDEVVPEWEKGNKDPKTKLAVTYVSPRGFRNYLYGGKYLENAVQATARDLMVSARVKARAEGIKVRFDVYDELVTSTKTEEQGLRAMAILSTPPEWWPAKIPLVVEADTMPRYAKTAPLKWKSWVFENGRLVA